MLAGRGAKEAFACLSGAVIAAFAVFVVSAAPAYAGDWLQAVCANPNGSAAGVSGWTLDAGPSVSLANSYIGAASGAPVENGEQGCLYLELASSSPNDSAVFQYTPPPGSTLDGGSFNIESYLPGAEGGNNGDDPPSTGWFFWPAASAPDSFTTPTSVFWQQEATGPYGWWVPYPGPWITATIPIPVDVGGDLYTGLAMTWPTAAATCGPGRPNPNPFCTFQVNSGAILLNNNSSPSGANFAGSLLAPGSVHGTAELTFTASDPDGPGVYRVIVKIDGSTVYQATPNTNRAAVPL